MNFEYFVSLFQEWDKKTNGTVQRSSAFIDGMALAYDKHFGDSGRMVDAAIIDKQGNTEFDACQYGFRQASAFVEEGNINQNGDIVSRVFSY